jgi:hypothetical protein
VTTAPSVSTPELLAKIEAVAAALDDGEVLQAITAIREHNQAPKLQLAIVGSTGSGRSSLVNALLHKPDFLPQSPIPKAAVGIRVRHGERTSITRLGSDGSQAAFPVDRLRALLMDSKDTGMQCVEIQVDSDLLELCDLRIEPLEANRGAGEWKALLGAFDYVILVLNSGALLSDAEKRFTRDVLAQDVGLERVAILINKMDLIPKDEQSSIVELVRTFLGPFESQPAILDLSIRDTLADKSGAAAESGLQTLLEDLLEQRIPLRSGAVGQSLGVMISALENTAARLDRLYSMEESDVKQALDTIASRQEWLQERINRVQRRVQAFVETVLKEGLLREVEKFGDEFRGAIPGQIQSVEDLTTIRRYLPGYIETVWGDFLGAQMNRVRRETDSEAATVSRMIEDDLEELLAEAGKGWSGPTADLGPDPHAFHVFVMPRRGKHSVTNVTRALSLQGFLIMWFSPAMGIASLAASQVLQHIYRKELREADREAIITSAVAASRELEREVKRRINQQFATTSADLKDEIAGVYREAVKEITGRLEERVSHREDIGKRRDEVKAIAAERLPGLRAMMSAAYNGQQS